MSYEKTEWTNGQPPFINNTNLNKIEQGIYENSNNIGDLNLLNTTNKSSTVDAINEIKSDTDTNIGDLSELETTEKSSLVGAINEINSKSNTYSTEETVIGTFFGKPLYRKCLDIPTSRFAEGQQYITGGYQIGYSGLGLTGIDMIAPTSNIYIITNANPVTYLSFPRVSFEYPQQATAGATFSKTAITINAGSSIVTSLRNATKVYAIMEYTKTTD